MPSIPTPAVQAKGKGITNYFENKIDAAEQLIHHKTQNLRRLEAQRNALNARVRLLREELQLLQEPGSYVGEVVKLMGKKKVLVKVQPEGKYGAFSLFSFVSLLGTDLFPHTQSLTSLPIFNSPSSLPISELLSAPTLVR
jgi:hypothetical protein